MILQVPPATAVTKPVLALTVATAVLLLLQAPVPPLNVTEDAEKVAVPAIFKGVVPVTVPAFAEALVVTVTAVRAAEGQEFALTVQVYIMCPLPVLYPTVSVLFVPEL
jgi:hypothetical protein